MSSTKLVDLALEAFAQAVAEPGPSPAGGSVAAAMGAFGAGLVSMAFRQAAGTSAVAPYIIGRAEELDDLRELLIESVDRDSNAYRALMGASKLPPDKAKKARVEAFEAPMEVAEYALAALRLCAVGASDVSAHLASDVVTARCALGAAIQSGLATAEVNLAAWPDDGDAAAIEDHRATIATIRSEAARLLAELEAADTVGGPH